MKRYLPFIIVIAVLVAAVVVGWRLLPKEGAAPTLETSSNTEGLTKPNVKVSSPVVLEEYGDYQCPPCGLLYPELKKIEAEYGDQLQIVFHHFPLTKIHKNALLAAHAAEAARMQNRFWEMHDRLYRNQKAWADSDDARKIFVGYAGELGLDTAKFERDLDSAEVEQRVNADTEQAMSRGINSTPTIIIEGRQLKADATTPDGIRRGINMMLTRKARS